MFVGSVAAGIPLVVSSAAHSLAHSATGQPHIHRGVGATDTVFEHATRQLAALVNKVRRSGVAPEDVRLAAAHFGTLAVYGQGAGIDTQTSRAVRDLIRSKGRDAVLDLDVDHARVVAELKPFGVDIDRRWLTPHVVDRGIRARALDDLSRNGVTGMFARAVSAFEHIAAELDRRGGRLTGVRLVQVDDSWKAEFCGRLWLDVSVQAAHAAMLCAAMLYMPGMEAECAFAQMAVMFFLAIYYSVCF
jgi:hypothetical protein